MSLMNIVIIGGLHHNTLGVLRSLGENGCSKNNLDMILIGDDIDDNNFISKSKYIDSKRVLCVNEENKIPNKLIDLAKDKVKRVVVACSDGATEVIINNKEVLQKYFLLPDTKMNISDLMLKEVQSELALEAGFSIPEGKVIRRDDLSDWDIFPCITKPIKSSIGAGKADIHIANNRNELLDFLKVTDSEYIQIQHYLNKKMEYQLIGCSLNAGEKIIIPGYTDIIRQPDNTNTGYLLYTPIEKFEYDKKAVESFIKKIGYSGLFSLEFIRDENKKDYFLEINMRNDGNAYCVKTAGINLPYIWCYYMWNNEMPDENITFETPVYFMPEFNDIKMGIKSVGLLKWLMQFCQAKSHAIFNMKDIKPFIKKTTDKLFRH